MMLECINGLAQDCSLSIAKAPETLQSYTKPSMYFPMMEWWGHWVPEILVNMTERSHNRKQCSLIFN